MCNFKLKSYRCVRYTDIQLYNDIKLQCSLLDTRRFSLGTRFRIDLNKTYLVFVLHNCLHVTLNYHINIHDIKLLDFVERHNIMN